MTRIGVFCGRFSPPHHGHIAAAKAFMEQMWLDFLYVIPMPEDQPTADPRHRLSLCRAAFAGMDGVYVSDSELICEKKRKISDILSELSADDRRLFLLLGTDTMLSLGEMPDVSEIFRLSYPVYVRREQDVLLDAKIIQKIGEYQTAYGKVVRRIVTEPLEISSATVRMHLRKGSSVSAWVPEKVEKYIAENHLYVSNEGE
ncbi:MAG: hypothetical protein IJW92_07695 [Clostridia bacterium]|nr:hypothetical protein [Clostridia bacterium]